jgi:hypothetical protein
VPGTCCALLAAFLLQVTPSRLKPADRVGAARAEAPIIPQQAEHLQQHQQQQRNQQHVLPAAGAAGSKRTAAEAWGIGAESIAKRQQLLGLTILTLGALTVSDAALIAV